MAPRNVWELISEATTHIESLEDNWDEQEARKPTPEILKQATSMLGQIFIKSGLPYWSFELPTIAPTGDGGVDLFWRDGEDSLLVNVSKHGYITYAGVSHNTEISGTVQPDKLDPFLDWVRKHVKLCKHCQISLSAHAKQSDIDDCCTACKKFVEKLQRMSFQELEQHLLSQSWQDGPFSVFSAEYSRRGMLMPQ